MDRQLDKMQKMMELQVNPETTPKGKGMTRNHSLAPKLFWVIENRPSTNSTDTDSQ